MAISTLRTVSLFLGLLAGGLTARSTETTLPFTAQSLPAWTVVGAPPSFLPETGAIFLPADTQLLRTFPAARLGISMIVRPIFGAQVEELPVIEIGSAALVFMQHEQIGYLALVSGEAGPVLLPVPDMLDAGGRTPNPLVIAVVVADGWATVTFGELSQRLPLGASTGSKTEVILSSGRGSALIIDQLDVTIPSLDSIEAESVVMRRPSVADAGPETSIQPAAGANARIRMPGSSTNAGTDDPTAKEAATPAVVSTLEVFTPPAVRHGRADSVRVTAFGAKQN